MNAGHKGLAVVGMTILIVASSVAIAQPSGPRGPRWQGRGNGPQQPGILAGRLNLSDEQAEKIRDITQQARTEGREAGQALAEAREALNDAVADGAEEEQIRSAANVLAQAIADQAVHQSKTRASIREVLTDEQREQLEETKKRGGRFGGRPRAWESRGRPQRGRGGRGSGWGRPASQMGRNDRSWQSNAGPGGPRGMRGPAGCQMGRPGRGRQAEWSPQMTQRGRGPWSNGQSQSGFSGPMGRRGPQGHGPQFLDRMFDRVDSNNDGVLGKEEVEAFGDKRSTGPESRPR